MSSKTRFLFTGVTGYIGGSVLLRFLDDPNASSFDISVLVRSPEKAEKLKSFGVTPIVGSHSDVDFMEKLTSEVDVVVAAANADDLPAALATLRGLKRRFQATGKPPIFIHTSGTGVLADKAKGLHDQTTIYDDLNADQIESLPPTQPHRHVDLELVKADSEGYVKTYIVLPSTIYGIATGKLVDAGIQNPYSIQIPTLIKAALDRKQAGMVGEGKNVWANVQIEEIADLYIVLYNAIVSNPQTGHGREGFYFGENDEYKYYDVCKVIGEELVKRGISTSPEPTTFTRPDLDKYFGGSEFLGSNSRCKANRSRSIGWKPVKTTKDLFESLSAEVDAWAKKLDIGA